MSKSDAPPVPPASRSNAQAGHRTDDPKSDVIDRHAHEQDTRRGASGNVGQNTRNQGHQQDR